MIDREAAHANYRRLHAEAKARGVLREMIAELGRTDLFYMLVFILHRPDADNDWVYERCREYRQAPDEHIDLWARFHYKSSIATFAGIIQGLANDPERTYCILSFTRPIAKAFLRQIKVELETNNSLPELYPDVFWPNPKRDSPKWSEDDGLVIKRRGNPKEASIEAWGLVDGQPTSKHFSHLHYEDIETFDTVQTEGMIKKTIEAFRNSLALGSESSHKRAFGTIWHYAGPNSVIASEKIMTPRVYTATKDNTFEGEPVLMSRERLRQLIQEMGPHVASAQLFMNPKMDSINVFREEWLRYWKADRTTGLNVYILCDPAGAKGKANDYTVFMVIGLGSDRNYYVIRWIRDRLSLVERANVLFKLHQQYRPVNVGYEQYGMQADIEHFQDRMQRDNYRFGIVPQGGTLSKDARIARLEPYFFNGRIYLPETNPYTQYDGETLDLTKVFVEQEYKAHPFEVHDDMLDCTARILDDDLNAVFPQGKEHDPMEIDGPERDKYDPLTFGLR